MARRHPLSACFLSLAALAALCLAPHRAFVVPPPPQLDLTAPTAAPTSTPPPSGHRPVLTLAFAFALVAGQLQRPARTVRRASSILEGLENEDNKDNAGAKEMEKEIEDDVEQEFFGEEQAISEEQELTAEQAARRGERQVVYRLYPARQYVLYIARKNAQRIWAKDGPKGPGTNIGCLEVQIALLTEKIRNQVLHVRECPHDYKCRLKLVSAVSRRRKMLDELSWKNLDSYLKVREELKIRHVYRLEALIGRLPSQKYAIKDRKQFPGRKTVNRLKKTKKLLARRLATQLRQGREPHVIHKTKKKIQSRKWLSRAYDEAEWTVAGRTPQDYIDPLNVP